MNATERKKRNDAIKEFYNKEMGEGYTTEKAQPGSAFVIEKLAKKHKLSVVAIYTILKSV